MSSSAPKTEPRAERVRCTEDELIVGLADGRTLFVPLNWFPRLASATAFARSQYELLGDGQGIHWPILDEDIEIAGLLTGASPVT